ncbi:MAG: hypothetical protein ACOY3P_20150 [Planctomycetota bacterium]
MGYRTGRGGQIDGINCLSRFRLREYATRAAVVCSASDGAEIVGPGNVGWEGVAVAYGHTPPVLPGEAFTFTGVDSGGTGLRGAAIVDKVVIFWPVEDARLPVHYHLQFSSRGALTAGLYSASAESPPLPLWPTGLGLKIDDVAFAVREMRLTIESLNAKRNDTATAGVTVHEPGNLRALVEASAYFDDFRNLPRANDLVDLKLDAGDSDYWHLQWGRVNPMEPQVVLADAQGRAVGNSVDLAFHWSSVEAGTAGQIVTPAGASFWPGGGT